MKGCLAALVGYFVVPAIIGAGVFFWALFLTGLLESGIDVGKQWSSLYFVGIFAWFLGATGPHFAARASSPLDGELVKGIFIAWLIVIGVSTLVSGITLSAAPLDPRMKRVAAGGAYIVAYLATGFAMEHWRSGGSGVGRGPRVR